MRQEQIEDLRNSLLTIMDEIHRVCEENEIKYYIIGGTALGAIRHSGFIPWDTDIDIAMRREDYNRFVQSANNYLNSNFYCASYINEERWTHPHALVFDKRTLIHWNCEYYKNKVDCPIYVDVFPLDYAPNDEKNQEQQAKLIRRKMYLQSRRECVLYQRNNLMQIVMKKIYAAALHIRSDYAFNKSMDDVMSKYSKESGEMLCSMASHYSYKKQLMPANVYGNGKLYKFEGRYYRGPSKINEYLERLYGDYMQLPPVEKRTEYLDYISYIEV